jgi:hypothetical protein
MYALDLYTQSVRPVGSITRCASGGAPHADSVLVGRRSSDAAFLSRSRS